MGELETDAEKCEKCDAFPVDLNGDAEVNEAMDNDELIDVGTEISSLGCFLRPDERRVS
jgi:hypothetical protein